MFLADKLLESSWPHARGQRCRTSDAFKTGIFLLGEKVLHPQKYGGRGSFASEFAKVDATSAFQARSVLVKAARCRFYFQLLAS